MMLSSRLGFFPKVGHIQKDDDLGLKREFSWPEGFEMVIQDENFVKPIYKVDLSSHHIKKSSLKKFSLLAPRQALGTLAYNNHPKCL